MLRKEERLSPDKQEEYILLETPEYKHYKKDNGWEAGERLIRVSIWISGNGCGVRQAYFRPAYRPVGFEHTAWEDHVKPVNGQLELEV